MDYYRNILITGCSSGLGQALFNKVWEDDNLNPFGHYRTEDGDPHALIGDITDPDFPEKLDNHISMITRISKVSVNGSSLDILWNDGEKSNFNYLWLRDNCPTAHDKDSRHRMFNILNISTNIKAKDFKINGGGKLVVEWSEGDHTSYCLLYTSPSPRD